jgi:ABC-2 type transport system permease protein
VSARALAARQLAAEQRLYWRNRGAAFFTFLLPILFLLAFGALGRNADVQGEPYSHFFVPGMLAMAVVVTTFAGLAITLVIRREAAILKRIRGTPLSPALYLAAMVASLVVVLVAEIAVVLLLGRVAFGVPIPERLDELAAVIALGAACFAALGIATSAYVPTAEGSSALVNAIYLPVLFLSGAFFPVSKMPAALQGVANALPLTHLIDALHDLFRGGSVTRHGLAGLLVTVAWGVAGVLLAMRSFRWEPRGG